MDKIPTLFCNNCGKLGHYYHQCKKPITSNGIVPCRYNTQMQREYLMICRRNTLGYVDFIRGKYPVYHQFYLKNLISEMTAKERGQLLTLSFDELWSDLWGTHVVKYHSEERQSRNKFKMLKEGVAVDNEVICLEDIILACGDGWHEPEWGFPKGRRNYMEKDVQCAIREFEEECGYTRDLIELFSNILPYEETFIGSNIKCYKHRYYVAFMKYDKDQCMSDFQKSEVSQMRWMSYAECLKHIRSYNSERICVLNNIEKTLNLLCACI